MDDAETLVLFFPQLATEDTATAAIVHAFKRW